MQTPTSTTSRRVTAVLAAIVLLGALTACTRTVDGTARYAGASAAPASQPLVKLADLPKLLPPAAEVGKVMNIPALILALDYRNLESIPPNTVANPQCVGVVFGVVEPVYRGSGYQGVYGQRFLAPRSLDSGRLDAGVVAFGDPEEARAFIARQSEAWTACASRPITLNISGQQVNWRATPPRLSNGVELSARTQEGGNGFGCARGLAAESNVVVDVVGCSTAGPVIADQVVLIANMMVAKIPT